MTEMQVVVTSALVILVGLIAFTIGMWMGHEKRDEEEEADLDRAVAWHPAGNRRGRHRQDAEVPAVGEYGPFPVTEEDIILLTAPVTPAELEPLPDERGFRHGCPVILLEDGSVTAWTKAMAADMDQFIKGMAEESNVDRHLIQDQS